MRGLSLVAASGGHSSSRCAGLSLSRPLLLRSTGSRRAGSVIVAHGLSRSAACGILPYQGSNPCPLHWQADSQPLCHQGSSRFFFLIQYNNLLCFHWSFQFIYNLLQLLSLHLYLLPYFVAFTFPDFLFSFFFFFWVLFGWIIFLPMFFLHRIEVKYFVTLLSGCPIMCYHVCRNKHQSFLKKPCSPALTETGLCPALFLLISC